MELTLLRLAIVLYLGATVAALVGVASLGELPRRILLWLLWGGLGVHGVAIIVRSVHVTHLAVTTFEEAL